MTSIRWELLQCFPDTTQWSRLQSESTDANSSAVDVCEVKAARCLGDEECSQSHSWGLMMYLLPVLKSRTEPGIANKQCEPLSPTTWFLPAHLHRPPRLVLIDCILRLLLPGHPHHLPVLLVGPLLHCPRVVSGPHLPGNKRLVTHSTLLVGYWGGIGGASVHPTSSARGVVTCNKLHRFAVNELTHGIKSELIPISPETTCNIQYTKTKIDLTQQPEVQGKLLPGTGLEAIGGQTVDQHHTTINANKYFSFAICPN